MRRFDISQTISVLANFGVLAGLLLVAIQISQSTEIAKAQLGNDYFLADMQLELAMMGESPVSSWIKAVYTPDELSRQDAAILDRYFNFGLIQAKRLRTMQKLGLAEDRLLQDQVDYLAWHLGNEAGRRWWAQYRSDDPDRDLVRMVDQALAATDYTQNRKYLDALMPATKAD